MRLSEFILRNLESLLGEWEAFAAQLPAAEGMTKLALRDHAKQILEAIARDLDTDQSDAEQSDKSMGLAVKQHNAAETAAETHGWLRAQCGFDVNQLASEFRALRAAVLRVWINECPAAEDQFEDMIRFNEAIDQAIIESVDFFSAQVEGSRNLLLGMLGHDMRSPLQAIVLTGECLARMDVGPQVSQAAGVLVRSAASIQSLLDDLCDFNRTQLGLGISIAVEDVDLAKVLNDELDVLRVAYPNRTIQLTTTGHSLGNWDGDRLQQVLRNLVVNAIKYGDPTMPIHVILRGEEAELFLEVKNCGPAIEPSALGQIFEPLSRAPVPEATPRSDGSLGLGLFIAREIAKGHGGDIRAKSDTTETVFTVRLPRGAEIAAV